MLASHLYVIIGNIFRKIFQLYALHLAYIFLLSQRYYIHKLKSECALRYIAVQLTT